MSFNARLQPTQIALGTAQNGTDKLKLNFDYGATQNNGNVLSQTITVPSGFTATQTYTYDALNRLKSATEMIGTQSWKQTFLYDRYGNRNFDTANTTTLGSCPTNQCNPTVDVSNNRFTSGQGYTYDLAGNIVADAQGRTFTYDAENKQKEVKDVNNVSIGTYFYDGDGKRVKKFIFATQETTRFVYDAQGQLIEEYVNGSSQPQVSNIYAGGRLLAVENPSATSYLTTDHLGSPRITTDGSGSVISRRDFLPFGEEVFTAQRTTGLGYTADNVRQKFTSYERDNESELDFAQNRYYNPKHGRFTTTDEPFADQFESNPQSWNLYPYARNNPLNLTDPLGMAAGCPPGYPDCIERDGKYFVNDPKEGEIEIDTTSPDPFTETREKDNKSNSQNTGIGVGFLSPLLEPSVKSPSLLRGSSARLITSPIGIFLLLGTIGIQDLYENGSPCFLCSVQGLRPGGESLEVLSETAFRVIIFLRLELYLLFQGQEE